MMKIAANNNKVKKIKTNKVNKQITYKTKNKKTITLNQIKINKYNKQITYLKKNKYKNSWGARRHTLQNNFV